jgi:hypothetical protein
MGQNAAMSKSSVISALIASVVLSSLSGCSDDDAGPLQLEGYGNVLDGARHSPYFTITMCAEGDEPADIKITGVEAVGFQGVRREPDFEVAWASEEGHPWSISSHGPVPDAFVPAVGEEGTIGPCSDSDQHSALAVVFPEVGHQPVRLEDVELTYEVDGDTYTTKAEAFLAQCPSGTVARTGTQVSEEQTLCRPIRKVRTS